MHLYRILYQGAPRWARSVDADRLELLAEPPFSELRPAGVFVPRAGAALLAPAEPTKVVAVGRNYAEHAKELGNEVPKEPLLFLKPPSAVLAPGGEVLLPPESQKVEHEAELAVVIGRRCRRVPPGEVLGYVLGYTCANDVTARDLQRKDVQFTRGKGFDTFCPLGPAVAPGLEPQALRIVCAVNGQVRQSGPTSDMVFPVAALLSYISAVMTLEPGDVVLTGTPAGVGPLVDGDEVEITIEGIGALKHRVRKG
jgi:2-keto-4-pentenoate hydratase/2-oxohepta-3-ene-1,7-dioic acid hydratase in catechol pathway